MPRVTQPVRFFVWPSLAAVSVVILGACGGGAAGGAKPAAAATPTAAPAVAAPHTAAAPTAVAAAIPAAPAAAGTVAMRSTRSGVYTAGQAANGGQVFDTRCSSCHTVESLISPDFKVKYGGKPLLALWKYVTDEMPQDNPGSLSDAEYVLVHAYILSRAGMPAGTTPLPADTDALKAIIFDTATSSAHRLHRR